MGALPSYKTPPLIALTDPPTSAQEIPRETAIAATFDMPMDPVTINGDNFLVSGQGGGRSGTITYDPLTHTATFTPDEPFAPGETVQAQLASGITNLWGVAMAEDYSWTFQITTSTDVETPEPTTAPAGFALRQNYPNPFNAETIIEYQVPQTSSGAKWTHVLLEIYNALGQRVCLLADGPQTAGWHSARWDGRDLHGRQSPSGVYFCRVEAGGRVEVKKLVLMR